MKALILTGLFLAACTQEPRPAAAPLTIQDVAAPRDRSTSAISGVVTQRDYGVVMLDSGGPNAIPLRIAPDLKVTLDGRPATGSDISQGDIVRAAYRFDESGQPLALTVVANSHPFSGRATPAFEGAEARRRGLAAPPKRRRGGRPRGAGCLADRFRGRSQMGQ